ncbi:MAG TPA: gephyrin-like molybdotransferase Glp [Gammaproteobacteria bacterium]
MISYQQALAYIRDCGCIQNKKSVPVLQALGRICAADIVNTQTIPAFDNAAMDGFAVRAADTRSATAATPLSLTVVGDTVAGDVPAAAVPGSAWEISTGAAIPQGYDSIVMVEHAQPQGMTAHGRPAQIVLSTPVTINAHIRRAGEDFKSGDTVIAAGTRLTPQHIMALVAMGIGEIVIYEAPTVAVISTGKELVDDHRVSLLPGQIRNANGPYLMAILARMHTVPEYAGIVPDEPDVFETKVRALAARTRIIVSTGAVSAGRHDFIAASLRRLGAEIIFHKVAIKPGKPILFARLPDGVFYLGLPGNPVSAAVGLRFFLYPLLCALAGMNPEDEWSAQLELPAQKKPGMRWFQKARLWTDAAGRCRVRILDGQESFRIKPMLEMNCWAILPEEQEYAAAGAAIAVASLYPGGVQ